MADAAHITDLLRASGEGDTNVLNQLLPFVYAELRRLAGAQLRRERSNHTLQPTALVNEAIVRLLGGQPVSFEGRDQLIGILGRTMRQVLVDSARRRAAGKRFSRTDQVDLDSVEISAEDNTVLSVDEALRKLEEIQPRQAHVVELKYFGGLTLEEISQVVGASSATVTRDWRLARSWLRRSMG
jgi:RNA polymerase sigma factor (TIGR02999 family)